MALPRGVRRLFRLGRPGPGSDEVDQELEHHLERSAEDLIRSGMAPEAARREAERRFGRRAEVAHAVRSIDRRRDARAARTGRWRGLRHDLTGALRSLRRSPGYVAVALATFLLGIGANVAVFTVVEGVLLRPLPYAAPEGIVRIYEQDLELGRRYGNVTIADLNDWREQTTSFERLSAFRWRGVTLRAQDATTGLQGAMVSADFFETLGVAPAMGRSFRSAEGRPGTAPVAILSDAAWRSVLGADPAIVGRTVSIDAVPTEIIGVLPRDFVTPAGTAVDVWLVSDFSTLASDPARARRMHVLAAFGRLASGVTVETATRDLDVVDARLAELHPEESPRHVPDPVPIALVGVQGIRSGLWLAMAAVGLLLLVACANLANLVLARALARRHELGIRAALGADRVQLTRGLVAEQLVLALGGTAVAVAVAAGAARGFLSLLGPALPRADRIVLDWRVVGFAVALALVTALVTALVPAALVLRRDLHSTLRADGRGATAGRASHRARAALVGAQVALATLLAAVSVLLTRSLANLLDSDLGFRTDRVLTFAAPLPSERYPGGEAVVSFQEQLLGRLAALPGVETVGASYAVPMRNVSTTSLSIVGRQQSDGPPPEVGYNAASPGYFATLGIPLLAGRLIEAHDRVGRPRVVVVNRALADRFFPDGGAVGARLGSGSDGAAVEIVGVVGDIRRERVDQAPEPELYYALAQDVTSSPVFVARYQGGASAFFTAVRALLRELDPEVPMVQAAPLDATVDATLRQPRFLSALIGLFAGLALLLAAVGVHGVIAYVVAERTREIGVRRALGANGPRVGAEVVRRGMRPVLVGLVVGVAGALGVGPLLRSMLYEVGPQDPLVVVAAALVTVVAGLIGCLLPAWRATRVDPLDALRG
ncbi:MAG: ADOP family duplicated permease [Gemmatimonadales bacterium]